MNIYAMKMCTIIANRVKYRYFKPIFKCCSSQNEKIINLKGLWRTCVL